MELVFPFAYIEDREIWGERFRFLVASQRGEHWYGIKWQAVHHGCDEASIGAHYNHSLRDLIQPGARIIDVGCNEGFVACCIAARAGQGGAVLAFDAVESNCVLAEANARLNRFPIRVHHRAVTAKSGETVAIRGEKVRGGHDGEQVATTQLDDWIDFAPNVIKIDCEGYELEVLRGARETLERFRPRMEIEVHLAGDGGVDMREYGFDPAELLSLLHDAGYVVLNTGRTVEVGEPLFHSMYHCIPR